ncbi:MAG: sigma-70 family RNA polymerase sigma factor [Coriobacteriia bacterium]|nr:sigma-70 family RNA polymerase sigma factor [Coriobacteriia bacterium]
MKQQLNKERLIALVDQVRADKEENFEQLYAELLPLVYYRALVLLNDREEAQKVTQAAFIHVYKHIEELKNSDYFQTWLNAVIASACRGMLQARKHEHDISAELGQDILADLLGGSESFSPDEALEAHEADEETWAAIQSLSQKQKEVILLYYVEGLSVDDIAGVLGVTYTAARSRLFKARRHLLVLLGEGEPSLAATMPGFEVNSALGRMDAMLIVPFITRQLMQFELSPNFGELSASVARLIPEHHSLLTVAPDIWSNVVRAVGLPALASATAPVIAGTAISASAASATAANASHLPALTLKLIPKLIARATANPAQAAVAGVVSVALVAGVAAGGVTLAHRAATAAAQKQAAAKVVHTGGGGSGGGKGGSSGSSGTQSQSSDDQKSAANDQSQTSTQNKTQSGQAARGGAAGRRTASAANAGSGSGPGPGSSSPGNPPALPPAPGGQDDGTGGSPSHRGLIITPPSRPTTDTPGPSKPTTDTPGHGGKDRGLTIEPVRPPLIIRSQQSQQSRQSKQSKRPKRPARPSHRAQPTPPGVSIPCSQICSVAIGTAACYDNKPRVFSDCDRKAYVSFDRKRSSN